MNKEKLPPIHALTGLRFIAALGVFLHHLVGKLGSTAKPSVMGDAGVTFFFVLSGFILTYVYQHRLSAKGSVRKFYYTRWARIWPLHIVTLVIYILLFMNFRQVLNHDVASRKLLACTLLVQSWIPIYGYNFAFNSVSWSISTEAFFYFMFPWLLLKRRMFWPTFFVLIAATAALLVLGSIYHDEITKNTWIVVPTLVHTLPVVRLIEFMTGMAIGRLYLSLLDRGNSFLLPARRRIIVDTVIEIAAIAALVWFYDLRFGVLGFPEASPIVRTFLAKTGPVLVFALIIFFFSHTQGLIVRFLSLRPMVYLGEISFAFYMVHMMVIHYLTSQMWTPQSLISGNLQYAAFFLSLAFSALLYEIVEMPCKDVLTKLYGSGFGSAFGAIKSNLQKLTVRPTVLIALATLAVIAFTIPNWKLETMADQSAAMIIRETKLFKDAVQFGKDAALFGFDSELVGEDVRIRLVWIKKRPPGRARTVALYDGEKESKKLAPSEFYAQQPLNEPFVEELLIPQSEFTPGRVACISFFSDEEKLAMVSTGPRQHFNRRLIIHPTEK